MRDMGFNSLSTTTLNSALNAYSQAQTRIGLISARGGSVEVINHRGTASLYGVDGLVETGEVEPRPSTSILVMLAA